MLTSQGLTAIADLAAIDLLLKPQSQTVFANTWVRAQQYDLQMQKITAPDWLPWTYDGHHQPIFPPGWQLPDPFQTNSKPISGAEELFDTLTSLRSPRWLLR